MKVNESSEPWPCDWEGAELYQLRRGASRTFRENLIWLEEATEFAVKFSRAPWHKEGIKPTSRPE